MIKFVVKVSEERKNSVMNDVELIDQLIRKN